MAQPQAIQLPDKVPVPESVAVKMITLRLVKIIKGIEGHNKSELAHEANAKQLMAQTPPPAWAQSYTAKLLPELQLSDLPDCARYARAAGQPSNHWHFFGDGKAIFELCKLWTRPEVTPRVVEAAWKVVQVHQVMGA